MERHSFDENGKRWIACCECERGGNGSDKDKCSCGWKTTDWNNLGCFGGTEIKGEIVVKKKNRKQIAKDRYLRFLDSDGAFDSFIDFCKYDTRKNKERLCQN